MQVWFIRIHEQTAGFKVAVDLDAPRCDTQMFPNMVLSVL